MGKTGNKMVTCVKAGFWEATDKVKCPKRNNLKNSIKKIVKKFMISYRRALNY